MNITTRSHWVATIFLLGAYYLLSDSPAMAACAPAGTHQSDTIVCGDTDTVGAQAGHGDDHVTVLPAANVDVQVSAPELV